MNKTEATDIMTQLKAMFPDWQKWVHELPTKNESLRTWYASLETQEKKHVESVIRDWQSGKRKCPETYERERLIYILVAAARELRNAEYAREDARNATKSYHAQAAEAAARRAGYKSPMDKSLGSAIREINMIADSIGKPKSQWTDEDLAQYFQQVDKITESYAATLDKR